MAELLPEVSLLPQEEEYVREGFGCAKIKQINAEDFWRSINAKM